MDPSTQAVPGYYVWEVPGKPVVVHTHLDAIDRLSAEIMRGFGAVPKRGAEVGGVLLGSVTKGTPAIVRIEDFEPVACEYKRGPSYLFVDSDRSAFDDTCDRWQPDPANPAYAVGYFRSHTRDGLSLGGEDIELMDQHFPSPAQIVLLVKPFATKVSLASFFVREDGQFPSLAPLEFPFRRRELTGEEAPPRRSMLERVPRRRERPETHPEMRSFPPEPIDHDPVAPPPDPGYVYASKTKTRPAWVWLPLSFVFLVLGVALGFQMGVTMGPKLSSATADDYALGLTVTRDGDNLSVRWNRNSAAVKAAEKGVLEIQDGAFAKPVELDTAQLRNASILFTNSSKSVRFRLIVYPQPGVTVMQSLEWKEQ